jgi:hypothetical protein
MKNLLVISSMMLFWACNQDPRAELSNTGSFGAIIENTASEDVTSLIQKLQNNQQLNVTVKGAIADFCKGEGCWLTLENNNGEPLLVEVKNNAFVLPYHIDGKTATVQGVALMDSADGGKAIPKIIANGIVID